MSAVTLYPALLVALNFYCTVDCVCSCVFSYSPYDRTGSIKTQCRLLSLLSGNNQEMCVFDLFSELVIGGFEACPLIEQPLISC